MVTYTDFVKTELEEHFNTFGVVYNQPTKEHCALRQATWQVDVDSTGIDQFAMVSPDTGAATDPALGPQAGSLGVSKSWGPSRPVGSSHVRRLEREIEMLELVMCGIATGVISTGGYAQDNDLDYEARVSLDLLRLPTAEVVARDSAVWVVVEIEPAADSGVLVLDSVEVNVEGRVVRSTPGKAGIRKAGSWHVERVIRGRTETTAGAYRWLEPDRDGIRVVEPGPNDVYDVFVRGGRALCHLVDSGSTKPFDACYLVPERWTDALVTAMRDVGERRELFTTSAGSDPKELLRLAHSDNEVLAALALVRLELDEGGELSRTAKHVSRFAVAASMVDLLRRGGDRDRALRFAEKAGERWLEGIALGLYAVHKGFFGGLDRSVARILCERCTPSTDSTSCEYVATVLRATKYAECPLSNED
jgi:hypothetical protein